MKPVNNKTHRILITASLASALWGGWAYYSNIESTGISSGILQGVLSFITSLILAYIVEFFHKILPMRIKTLSAYLPYALFTPIVYASHYYNGTKNILITIIPPLLVGLVYMTFYVFFIKKEKLVSTQNEI